MTPRAVSNPAGGVVQSLGCQTTQLRPCSSAAAAAASAAAAGADGMPPLHHCCRLRCCDCLWQAHVCDTSGARLKRQLKQLSSRCRAPPLPYCRPMERQGFPGPGRPPPWL